MLVAAGLTNQEIAEQLYLSINTVKTYIRYGYRKIGAERRSHAVVWVERHGLASTARAVGRTAEPHGVSTSAAPGRLPLAASEREPAPACSPPARMSGRDRSRERNLDQLPFSVIGETITHHVLQARCRGRRPAHPFESRLTRSTGAVRVPVR